MRALLVRSVEAALIGSGLPWIARRRLSGKALVLAFHNVVPDGIAPLGDRSLHLPLGRFRAVLDAVVAVADVVPLTEVHHRSADARPAVALTFDDCYAGFAEFAVPELVGRGLPATVFVAPGILGGRSMWWDALAGDAGLDPVLRATALGELRGDDASIRAWAAQNGRHWRDLPAPWRTASHDMCEALARQPGMRLASHSWSHLNLSALEAGEAMAELTRTRDWLRTASANRWTPDLSAVAYPYGMAPTAEVCDTLRAEHGAGYLVSGGWLDRRPADRTRLPRLNVPAGLSPSGLALRLSGLMVRT